MTPMVTAKNKKPIKFDPKTFLSTIYGGRKIAAFFEKKKRFLRRAIRQMLCFTSGKEK
jgi:hypothetical protein